MTATLIDIKAEQEKVKEAIKAQGLRVLVCAGTGCVANGSLKVIERFKEQIEGFYQQCDDWNKASLAI